MDVILGTVRWKSALLYLEVIVVFSRSPQDQVNQVWRELQLLYKTGVSCKLHTSKRICINHSLLRSRFLIWLSRHAQPTTDAVTKLAHITKEEDFPLFHVSNMFS